MAQHEYLGVLRRLRSDQQRQPGQEVHEDPVQQTDDHRPRSRHRSAAVRPDGRVSDQDTQQWTELTADLQDADTHRDNLDRPTDWADLKRLSASAWVWARVTGSEQRLAPAFRAAPHRTAPTSLVGATKSARYHLEHRDYGHYAALRRRLTTLADALAAQIDSGESAPTI